MPSKQLMLDTKYDPQNLFLNNYNYSNWYKREEELAGKTRSDLKRSNKRVVFQN